MNSFNHYALGAVVAWMYGTVAGIRPAGPGFRNILFAPRPGGSLEWANASVPTPYGETKLEWSINEQSLTIELIVPVNTEAKLEIPEGWSNPIDPDSTVISFVPGNHQIALRKVQD